MARSIDIATAARALLDTPFVHQGRRPGVGLDCIGVIVCAAEACGLKMNDFAAYGRRPNPKQLLEHAASNFVRVDEPRFGDVGLCWVHQNIRGMPHHAFILAPGPKTDERWMIHSWMEVGRAVWNPYSSPWTENTYGFYRYMGVED